MPDGVARGQQRSGRRSWGCPPRSSNSTPSSRPGRRLVWRRLRRWKLLPYRNLLHHLDAETFQGHDLPRMIGQQADGVQPQVGENLRADAVLVLQLPLAVLTLVVHEVAPMAEHRSEEHTSEL